MTTLADRRTFVQLILGNRADISSPVGAIPSRVDNWIWQSYLNIGMSFSFEQAEMSVTDNLAVGGDGTIAFPDDARMIKAITPYRDDGTAIQFEIKNMQYIRRYNKLASGTPSTCAFYADKIHFRPLPDANYPVVIDYWQKPQLTFVDPNAPTDPGPTELKVPDDWLEVVDLGAAMRGHIALLERDKAQEIQHLLFGFTIPTTGRQVPGLIAQMYNRRQAQAPTADYGLVPRQARRSYTSVS